MKRRQERLSEAGEWNEWADLSAWQGYEFWSAQLEAEMVSLGEWQDMLGNAPLPVQEGKSDGLPF